MVEAGVSAAAVFTEVKDRQLKPFNLKDSAGNPLSGVIPLNSRPVLGAGGFQVSARQPFHFASDRYSVAPEATYGLAWGPDYSTMFWSLAADTSFNFLNGNARISAKLGYGGYKVESNATFPEMRHGFKAGLEGAMRLASNLNFVSQAGVTQTSDGPQTIVTFGAQWLFDLRPEPPVDLDGSVGRQSLTVATQLLDNMDRVYYTPNAMAEVSVGSGDAIVDRLLALSSIALAFIKGESYATLPAIDDALVKVQVALDFAANNGIKAITLSPYRKRIRDFKETRYVEILKHTQEILNEIEHKQCHKAAALADSGDYEFAGKTLKACAENLKMVQALSTTLEPVLPPMGKVEVTTLQRKLNCLLKAEECTSDLDPEKTVPAIQKKIKAAGNDAEAAPKTERAPEAGEKPAKLKKLK